MLLCLKALTCCQAAVLLEQGISLQLFGLIGLSGGALSGVQRDRVSLLAFQVFPPVRAAETASSRAAAAAAAAPAVPHLAELHSSNDTLSNTYSTYSHTIFIGSPRFLSFNTPLEHSLWYMTQIM